MNSTELLLRPAIIHDMNAIAQINDLAFKNPCDLKVLRSYQKEHGRFTIVAEYRKQVIGFMCVRRQEDQFYLGLLAIAPAHQGKGVGCKLVEWLIAALERCNLKTIRLHAHHKDPAPQQLYKKLGFVIEGRQEDYYLDGSSALKMVFRLTNSASLTKRAS